MRYSLCRFRPPQNSFSKQFLTREHYASYYVLVAEERPTDNTAGRSPAEEQRETITSRRDAWASHELKRFVQMYQTEMANIKQRETERKCSERENTTDYRIQSEKDREAVRHGISRSGAEKVQGVWSDLLNAK